MISMLIDPGVWLALTYNLHPHHVVAQSWRLANDSSQLVICRVTQMSLLRLWSNPAVMGDGVCTQSRAWSLYFNLMADPQIGFVEEPADLDSIFQRISNRDEVSPKRWTDDYLVAFATTAGLTLVTFDKALAARAPQALLLKP